MDKRLDFRFEIPRPPCGPVVELSNAEAEKILLDKLAGAATDPRNALWELAQFYKLSGQHEKALVRLRELIERLPNPEDKANCVFTMGQTMEQVGDYAGAIRYYKEAETRREQLGRPQASGQRTEEQKHFLKLNVGRESEPNLRQGEDEGRLDALQHLGFEFLPEAVVITHMAGVDPRPGGLRG